MICISIENFFVSSLSFSEAVWQSKTGSTVAQLMAWCLMPPIHDLNKWPIIWGVLSHSLKSNSINSIHNTYRHILKLLPDPLGASWLISWGWPNQDQWLHHRMVFYLQNKYFNIDKVKCSYCIGYLLLKQISLTQMQMSATSQRP